MMTKVLLITPTIVVGLLVAVPSAMAHINIMYNAGFAAGKSDHDNYRGYWNTCLHNTAPYCSSPSYGQGYLAAWFQFSLGTPGIATVESMNRTAEN